MSKAKTSIRRSPPNPERSLEKAIGDAQKLHLVIGSGPIDEKDPRIALAWDLGVKSSGWNGRSAALKQYGLLQGGLSDKTVMLTTLAVDLIADRKNIDHRKQAFMNVDLYQSLLESYGSARPTPSEVEQFFIDKGCTEKRAWLATRIFTENANYAHIYGDKTPAVGASTIGEASPPRTFKEVLQDESDKSSDIKMHFGQEETTVTITIEGKMSVVQLVEKLQQLIE